jgi:hypothetical protein
MVPRGISTLLSPGRGPGSVEADRVNIVTSVGGCRFDFTELFGCVETYLESTAGSYIISRD